MYSDSKGGSYALSRLHLANFYMVVTSWILLIVSFKRSQAHITVWHNEINNSFISSYVFDVKRIYRTSFDLPKNAVIAVGDVIVLKNDA